MGDRVSESAPEGGGGGGGGFFTRKIGALPVWGWTAIVAGLFLVYSLYKGKKNTAAQSASTVNQPGGVDASLVPQFINQTYDNDMPPVAPNVTVNNTVPTSAPSPPPVPTPPPPSTVPATPNPPANRPSTPFEPIFNGTYTVRKGQTLDQVAAMFHISREQLAHANGLGTGAGLRTGQKLRVPVPAPAGKPNKAM